MSRRYPSQSPRRLSHDPGGPSESRLSETMSAGAPHGRGRLLRSELVLRSPPIRSGAPKRSRTDNLTT